jgi:hypothetical protein
MRKISEWLDENIDTMFPIQLNHEFDDEQRIDATNAHIKDQKEKKEALLTAAEEMITKKSLRKRHKDIE